MGPGSRPELAEILWPNSPVSTPRPLRPLISTAEEAIRFMASRPYTASCRLCKFSSISMGTLVFLALAGLDCEEEGRLDITLAVKDRRLRVRWRSGLDGGGNCLVAEKAHAHAQTPLKPPHMRSKSSMQRGLPPCLLMLELRRIPTRLPWRRCCELRARLAGQASPSAFLHVAQELT